MITTYFVQIESVIQTFPNIRSYSLRKKIYNTKQGYIGGTITFTNGYRLEFVEVKNTDIANKVKYRYHYMDANQTMIFRYDNAPHHKHILTFLHHKHSAHDVQEADEPTLYDVLIEIANIERYSNL